MREDAVKKATTTSKAPRWMEYVPLIDVKGNPRNPKDHDLGGIHASIRRWSLTGGVLLDERTGLLAAGHGRIEVLRQMEAAGGDPPDGIVADPARGWLLPIQRGWASKDDDEAIAYVVADNRIGEIGGWDEALLAAALEPLAKADKLEGVGFDMSDVQDLVKTVDSVALHEVEPGKTKATFWISVKGPLAIQPEALEMLKMNLKGLPGVVVDAGVLVDKK